MKKIYRYSEQKFLSFTKQKQVAIIQEMLEVLEKNYSIKEYSLVLQESLKMCFDFIEDNDLLANLTWKSYDLTKLSDIIELRDEILRKEDISLKDTDIIIKRYDSVKEEKEKFPLVIILDNLRSAFNVGSIVRSSECLGVSEIVLCGKTPGAENRKVRETSMGILEYIKIIRYETIQEAISAYRKQDFEIIALELTNNSILLENYRPAKKVALILGNESLGVAEETIALCDKIIEIKMYGVKNSLNVSNASAIATHTIIQQMEAKK